MNKFVFSNTAKCEFSKGIVYYTYNYDFDME